MNSLPKREFVMSGLAPGIHIFQCGGINGEESQCALGGQQLQLREWLQLRFCT
jgi:hypothetical protein